MDIVCVCVLCVCKQGVNRETVSLSAYDQWSVVNAPLL